MTKVYTEILSEFPSSMYDSKKIIEIARSLGCQISKCGDLIISDGDVSVAIAIEYEIAIATSQP